MTCILDEMDLEAIQAEIEKEQESLRPREKLLKVLQEHQRRAKHLPKLNHLVVSSEIVRLIYEGKPVAGPTELHK